MHFEYVFSSWEGFVNNGTSPLGCRMLLGVILLSLPGSSILQTLDLDYPTVSSHPLQVCLIPFEGVGTGKQEVSGLMADLPKSSNLGVALPTWKTCFLCRLWKCWSEIE